MKFFVVVSAVLGLTLASPVKRDAATIKATGEAITAALTKLDAAIVALTAENAEAQLQQMDTLSDNVVAALTDGAAKIKASKQTSLSEAMGLLQSSTALTTAANQTMQHLIAQKEIIAAAGHTDEVVAQLRAQQQGTTVYVEATIGNLPSIARSLGGQAVSAIAGLFDRAVAQFTDGAAPAAGAA